MSCSRRRRHAALVGITDGVFDAPRDLVDRLRVGADRVKLAVLAPAGDVGHALTRDVEADGAADDVGDAVDEYLRPLTAEIAVADS